MADDPRLLDIRDAIAAKLGTVLTVAGFRTDIGLEGHVHFVRRDLAVVATEDFPRSTIIWGHAGSREGALSGEVDQENLGPTRDGVAYWAIIVQVKAADPDAEILRALADVTDVLLVDPTLGGTCELIRFVNAGGDWQEYADTERGEVGILFATEYNWEPGGS